MLELGDGAVAYHRGGRHLADCGVEPLCLLAALTTLATLAAFKRSTSLTITLIARNRICRERDHSS